MIVDLKGFQNRERPYWEELAARVGRLERDAAAPLSLEDARRLHYLYRRTAADLNELRDLPGEIELRRRLETLVARAYAEVYETRRRAQWRRFGRWLRVTLPQTFRRRARAFRAALAITLVGAALGAGIVLVDYDAKPMLLPFPHLHGDPSDRVAFEEAQDDDAMADGKVTFSAMLMANNIRVSIFALGLGLTFGVGTVIVLFYNGVILGAVACDYVLAGEGVFLLGWLLPHGSVEIPAILIAGQAGLVLGQALIGWGTSLDARSRFRAVRTDLVGLMFGVALLLVWAAFIESFFSQYHEPILPYGVKIAFGGVQLVALFLYLYRAGRRSDDALEDVPA